MSFRPGIVGLSALVGLLPLPAGAQEPVAAPGFGETVEVRVVNLEVVVTDRDGVTVTGLAPGDFELRVDGEATAVRYFSEIRSGTAVATGEAPAEGVGGVPDVVPGEPVGTSYLVFVDDFFPLARDRDRVLASLREQARRLRPEDRMALVAFDGKGVTMLTTWTNSARELDRAFRAAAARPALGLQRLSERRSLAADRAPFGRGARRSETLDTRLNLVERYYAKTLEQQLSRVVSAARTALRSFANPPGRKVMLLLSGGWPYELDDYASAGFGRIVDEPGLVQGEELYAPLVDIANQTGYTLFPVDIPGLGSGASAAADRASVPSESDRFVSFLGENNAHYTLERLARETGGQALLNSRRLEALESVEAATRTYYWIGFVPTWQGDDRRHAVEVRVLREGLRTSTRGGFVDFSRKSEVSAMVESVLLFGSGPGTRPLDLALGRPIAGKGRTMKVPLSLSVPVEALTLLPDAGGTIADLEIRVAAADDSGGISEIPVLRLRQPLPFEPPAGARVRYETTLELRRSKNHLAVAVYDLVSGALWTATADVQP